MHLGSCTLDATLDCFLISPSLSDPRLLSHFLVKEVASFLSKSLPSSSSKKTQIHSCKQLDGKIFMGSHPVRITYFFLTSSQSQCSLQMSDQNKNKITIYIYISHNYTKCTIFGSSVFKSLVDPPG